MLNKSNLTKNTDELKRLIAEHPDYPIAVLAGEEANRGEFSWMYCSNISFEVGEMLDTDFYDYNDSIITDRDRLEEIVEDRLFDDGLKGAELERAVQDKIAELDPYWIDVIFIWATN